MSGRHALPSPPRPAPPTRCRCVTAITVGGIGALLILVGLVLTWQVGPLDDATTIVITVLTVAGAAGICTGIWLLWAPQLLRSNR